MMAGRTRQAGSKDLVPARAGTCLAVAVATGTGPAVSTQLAKASQVGAQTGPLDPGIAWEILIGAVVVCAFLASVALWIHAALRRVKRSQARKTAFVSSALNNLSHGVVMTDPRNRVVFCNDRYLDIYGLSHSEVPRSAPQL